MTQISAPPLVDEVEVLVVDDEPAARELVNAILECEGWPVPDFAEDGPHALEQVVTGKYDIVITDLDLPGLSGDDLIEKALAEFPDLTVLVMTGYGTIDRAVDLMKFGVFDFICKPFEVDRFLLSLQKAKERALNISEKKGIREVVEALLAALESKDNYLNGHSARVAEFARRLGGHLGLGSKELKILEYAALLHDVGKIGVHEDILNKPGALSKEEFDLIKRHPIYSRDILAPVSFLRPCLPGVLYHHERIDGKGYPEGLGGEDIPMVSRVISVVDAFDAMSSHRAYRKALPIPATLKIIGDVAGTQLDAEIAEVFLNNFESVTQELNQPRTDDDVRE